MRAAVSSMPRSVTSSTGQSGLALYNLRALGVVGA